MNKYDIVKKFFIYFMLYAIIGWCYEVFLEVVVYQWGFSNRGVLFGPYCPVYGFGALAFILCLAGLKKKKIEIGSLNITPFLVFLGIVLIATSMELIASYIMQLISGSWMWDYTNYPFNFEGRIALNPSLRFGIGGMIFMYVLQPLFEKMTGKFSKNVLNIVFYTLAIIMIIELVVKCVGVI